MPADAPTPLLLNRELSLLKFNERVLAMAERPDTPLLERLRYYALLAPTSTNSSRSGFRA